VSEKEKSMKTITTEGVKITVTTKFRADLSQVNENRFFFNYHIEMENNNENSLQLMHRDWYIFDSLNKASIVSGEGVIGEQPILNPRETFSYTSGCELTSELGRMRGFYTFKNQLTGQLIQVFIPTFDLVYPAKLN
jgi:ApaG protein